MILLNTLQKRFRVFRKFLKSEITRKENNTCAKSATSTHKTGRHHMMSYLSLKDVLVNFDPNLRIELSYRCPSLRRVNNSIPLKIDTLSISASGLKINSHTYQIKRIKINKYLKGKELRNSKKPDQYGPFTSPEGIFITFEKDAYHKYLSPFAIDRVVYREDLNPKIEEAMVYFFEKIFGNRTLLIQVNKMDIVSDSGYLVGLKNIKLRVTELQVDENVGNVLDTIDSCLDGFPLKCLTLEEHFLWDRSEKYSHRVVRTAEVLRINEFPLYVYRISNLRVHLKHPTFSFMITKLMEHWLNNGREVGTHFTINSLGTTEDRARSFWMTTKETYNSRIVTNHRAVNFPDTLKIRTRFSSEVWLSVVKGSGDEWICELEVRSAEDLPTIY